VPHAEIQQLAASEEIDTGWDDEQGHAESVYAKLTADLALLWHACSEILVFIPVGLTTLSRYAEQGEIVPATPEQETCAGAIGANVRSVQMVQVMEKRPGANESRQG